MDKNVDFRAFFFRFIILLSEVDGIVHSVGHFFGLLFIFLLYMIRANFCHHKPRFDFDRRKSADGDWASKNHTHILTHKHAFAWMDLVWCRLKIIRRISNVRKLSLDIYLISLSLGGSMEKPQKIRPPNTMQLILWVKWIKKYTRIHKTTEHIQRFQMPIIKLWFQINDELNEQERELNGEKRKNEWTKNNIKLIQNG